MEREDYEVAVKEMHEHNIVECIKRLANDMSLSSLPYIILNGETSCPMTLISLPVKSRYLLLCSCGLVTVGNDKP